MSQSRRGGILVLSAYGAWGVLPLYWEQLAQIAPAAVLAQRVFWSVLMLGAWLALRGGLRGLAAAAVSAWPAVLGCAALLGLNWYIYLWALQRGEYVAASLGYFICPLVTIALGALLCGERLDFPRKCALALMAAGVVVRAAAAGEVPVIAIALAVTWSFYQLLRKRSRPDPAGALLCEMALIAAVLGPLFLFRSGAAALLSGSAYERALMIGAGVVTVLPLLAFVQGARQVPLVFLGWSQYLAPTIMLAVAVLIQGYDVPPDSWISFGLIWLGIAGMLGGDRLAGALIKRTAVPARP